MSMPARLLALRTIMFVQNIRGEGPIYGLIGSAQQFGYATTFRVFRNFVVVFAIFGGNITAALTSLSQLYQVTVYGNSSMTNKRGSSDPAIGTAWCWRRRL